MANEKSAPSYRADNKKNHEAALDSLADDHLFVVETINCARLIWKDNDGENYLCEDEKKYRIKTGTKDKLEQVTDGILL